VHATNLKGIIEDITLGDVLAHVTIRIGDDLIESVITRCSAEDLELRKGDRVSAVVKATEVMIAKSEPGRTSRFQSI
jgi:molybdopterin-binding protein